MAVITWHLTNTAASVYSELNETDPGAEAYRSPVTGWIVGTGATNRSPYDNDVEQAASTFDATTYPDGSLNTTTGDGWRTQDSYSGDFASGTWTVDMGVRAQTNGGAQDGLMHCRLFRGAAADGSDAVEITAAAQAGGTVTDLTTTTTQRSTASFNPGAFSVSGEFIFLQLAWERTGAGGMANSDVNLRVGNASSLGCRVLSADFTVSGFDPAGSAGAYHSDSPDLQAARL